MPAAAAVAAAVGAATGGVVLCAADPAGDEAKVKTIAESDALFDQAEYRTVARHLAAAVSGGEASDWSKGVGTADPELLWRLARVFKKLADAEDNPKKEELTRAGFMCATAAVERGADIGPAHKWFGIILSEVSGYGGTSETIKQSYIVKEHFDTAAKLSPTDATSRHLLGVWCFEVASLSWIARQAASAIFGTPPTASYEEAYAHFAAAEEMDPGFYPKNMLMLAKACMELGRGPEAQAWLAKCVVLKAVTPEDEETLEEARVLKMNSRRRAQSRRST